MIRALAALLALAPSTTSANALCDAVALEVRAAATSSPGRLPALDDLKAVAVPSPPLEPFRSDNDAEAIAELKRRFNASGPGFEIVTSSMSLQVTQVGRTGPIALWDEQGTAHCSVYALLLPGGDGPATAVPAPPAAEEHDLCWLSSAWLGEINGQPVFAVEDRDPFTPATSIDITAWRDGEWAEACRVDARYQPKFVVTDALYRDPAWKELGIVPEGIAEERHRRDGDTAFSFYQPKVDSQRFEAMLKLTNDLPLDLPRFGEQPSAFDTFEVGQSPFFPLVVDGQTYLGRIGHGTVGWRVISDYLIGVWDLVDGKLEPVASFTVSTKPDELTSLRVSKGIPFTRAPEP